MFDSVITNQQCSWTVRQHLKRRRVGSDWSEIALCSSMSIRKGTVLPAGLIALHYFDFIVYLQLAAKQKTYAAHIFSTFLPCSSSSGPLHFFIVSFFPNQCAHRCCCQIFFFSSCILANCVEKQPLSHTNHLDVIKIIAEASWKESKLSGCFSPADCTLWLEAWVKHGRHLHRCQQEVCRFSFLT